MKKAVKGILVVLFSCLGLQSGVFAENSIEVGAYLNILSEPGGQWLYEDELGNETLAEVLTVGSFKGIDAGRIQMVSTDTYGVKQTLIQYFQAKSDGLYQVGMAYYQGESDTETLAFLSDAPHLKLVALPTMDADDDPMVSEGTGKIYYGGATLTDAAYYSSIGIEGIENLVMPFGTFKVLKMTSEQFYTHDSLPFPVESTFTLYIEPNLGVLALEDDESGRVSLTGIANIPVPGDTDSDADVDGVDLTGEIAEGAVETLAGYFGVSVPVIAN
nr:hypothetical protein [uncultured Desulfobacter sp.]